MDFNALASSVWSQIVTVWTTPVPFLAALLVVGYGIWKVVQWQFGVRIANLNSQLDLYREAISFATGVSPEASPSGTKRAAPTPSKGVQASASETELTPREFLDPSVTLDMLKELVKDKTAIAAEDATQKYLGKWMTVSGFVFNVTRRGNRITVTVFKEKKSHKLPLTQLEFKGGPRSLSELTKGAAISAIGRLKSVAPIAITFTDCELVP